MFFYFTLFLFFLFQLFVFTKLTFYIRERVKAKVVLVDTCNSINQALRDNPGLHATELRCQLDRVMYYLPQKDTHWWYLWEILFEQETVKDMRKAAYGRLYVDDGKD